MYKSMVNKDMTLYRRGNKIEFSSKSLLTSLMRIGLSYDAALEATEKVVLRLDVIKKDIEDQNLCYLPRTAHIRSAIQTIIKELSFKYDFSMDHADLLFSAYIRRYGNPNDDYIKVIDSGVFYNLNFSYLKETLLPDVVTRILHIDKMGNPFDLYPEVLSMKKLQEMAKSVLKYVNSLNLYSIRYKTLINLIQDLTLEPPHPWFVSSETKNRITKYNVERAGAHYKMLHVGQKNELFDYSARGCIQHSCAAILSYHGAFLGVDQKYGLSELCRVLSIKDANPAMWEYCEISSLPNSLRECNVNVNKFLELLKKGTMLFGASFNAEKRNDTHELSKRFFDIMSGIVKFDA